MNGLASRPRLAFGGLPWDLKAAHLVRPQAGRCNLCGPHASRLLVGHVLDRESSEVLLGLDVGAIGKDWTAVGGVHAEYRRGVVQTSEEDVDAGSLHLRPQ